MAEPLFVRESVAGEVRRLRRQAEAFDALLERRLADRAEPPADFTDVGVPDEDTVLLDTALYHAAAERTQRARELVRRERLMLAALAAGVVLAAITSRR